MKNIPVKASQLKDLKKGLYSTIVSPSRRMKKDAKRRARIEKKKFSNKKK
jgi:hypothetical protein